MTLNQIRYQELELAKSKEAREASLAQANLDELSRHNLAVESESARHNKEVEAQAIKQLDIAKYQADIANKNADTNRYNAETNRLNYGVNMYNAQSGRIQAYAAQAQAAAAQVQAQAAVMNAQTNARNADTNAYNARINAVNAETNKSNAKSNAAQARARLIQAYAAESQAASKVVETTIKWLDSSANRALVRAQIDKVKADRNLSVEEAKAVLAKVGLTEAQTKKVETETTRGVVGIVTDILGGISDLFDFATDAANFLALN